MKKAELLEEIRLAKASLFRLHKRVAELETKQALQDDKIEKLTQALDNFIRDTYTCTYKGYPISTAAAAELKKDLLPKLEWALKKDL